MLSTLTIRLCACRSRMAWPYKSVLCPPPWDDCRGEMVQSEHRLPDLQHLPKYMAYSQVDYEPIKWYVRAGRRETSVPNPQYTVRIHFTIYRSRAVYEKPRHKVFYTPQGPDARGSGVQGSPWLLREFEARLGYKRFCLKNYKSTQA